MNCQPCFEVCKRDRGGCFSLDFTLNRFTAYRDPKTRKLDRDRLGEHKSKAHKMTEEGKFYYCPVGKHTTQLVDPWQLI